MERNGATYHEGTRTVEYKGKILTTPLEEPLETHREATIEDLDTVKEYLLTLGWEPTEWGMRDLTKDSNKKALSALKMTQTFNRYIEETKGGKYKEGRLKDLGLTEKNFEDSLLKALKKGRTFMVPTAPKIKVGVAKELCPSLVKLGDKVSFAKDFADYLTYRHRRSAIAGGDISEKNLQEGDSPDSGYLAYIREDGRISTPAIEVGANTFRYTHKVVTNVPRASNLFGDRMRALFGCGEGYVQLGYDFSSLENRIQGHFVYPYYGGPEMSEELVADKPNDQHTLNSKRLGITRDEAKTFQYAVLYGASPKKLSKTLSVPLGRGEELYKLYWEGVPALSQLKKDKEREWIQSGKKFVRTIDGRTVNIRSQHSILNALFQSSGVIFAKYVLVNTFQKIEALGYNIDPFKGPQDVGELIAYHDENQLRIKPNLLSFKTFNSKEEAEDFVKNWEGDQLGNIQKGKGDKFFICLPNIITKSLNETIREVEGLLGLNVRQGAEFSVGRTWLDCH